jgi:N-acetylmuramoyl-L-alanine amidase CwlA
MEIKENITTRNYTRGNNRSIKYIVVHYVGAVSTAKNNSDYFKSIYRVVRDEDIAWHCGTTGKYYSNCRNSNSIGIEMCCYNNNGTLDISENIVNRTIELVKELMAKYKIPAENVIRHYDVTHKCCPAPFVNNPSRWNDFKNRLGGTVSNTPSSNNGNKSNEEIANEVIAGKWGNGDARKTALQNAGYNYSEIQAIVNQKLTGKISNTTTSNKKSIDTIVVEVIAGKWGNGEDRKTRLQNAGYNYNEVQAAVNNKLSGKSTSSNKKSNETIANEVIKGLWGNGTDRKNRLTAAGYDYNAIQKIVNQKLR